MLNSFSLSRISWRANMSNPRGSAARLATKIENEVILTHDFKKSGDVYPFDFANG